jgi:hypothetical protein
MAPAITCPGEAYLEKSKRQFEVSLAATLPMAQLF